MTPLMMLPTAGLVLAMAAPADGNVSIWAMLMPWILILGIFYFVILLPMKRRQKKTQQFLDGLKPGDRVVTTGGIYGTITKVGDRSIQLQIADKVRIELSRAAIAGLQGQEPVVPDSKPQ